MSLWKHCCACLAILIPITTVGLGAAPSPTPCSITDGDLTSTTPQVAYDDTEFVYKEARFPVHVFSLAGITPWTTNFLCLRYELKNAGDQKIPLIYWKLVNEKGTFDLVPGDPGRLRRVLRRPSAFREAVQGPTVIKAFRSEEITTIAWQRMEDWQAGTKKAGMWEQTPYLHFDRSAALDPAAKRAIEQGLIADAEVAVIEPPSDVVPPPVGDALGTSDGVLNTVSQLLRDPGDPLRGLTVISAKLAPKVRAEAFAPALVAMENYPENTEAYLEPLKSAPGSIGELSEKGRYFGFSLKGAGKRVFIVEHPISLHWFSPEDRHTMCIKVASYSPFPISLDENYCVM